jgi:CHAD domain-containing protein
MEPVIFERSIRKLYAELQKLHNTAVRTAEVEAIHNMRVQIKKLSSVYSFLDASKIAPVRRDKYYTDLRRYFKTAGKLREFQLHSTMIDSYRNRYGNYYTEYEAYNNCQATFVRDCFSGNRAGFPGMAQKSVRSAILMAVKKTDPVRLNQHAAGFIDRRLKKIESYYLIFNSETCLHKIRQTIKELRYFLEIYTECSAGSGSLSVNFEEIKKVEEMLGGWNDKRIFREDVERFVKYYSLLHAGSRLPAYQKLTDSISEDALLDIKDIQPVLLRLITGMALDLLMLK